MRPSTVTSTVRCSLLSLCICLAPASAVAQDFNQYILKAVDHLAETRALGGYDIRKSFTRHLDYNGDQIRASGPPKTMCVAAIVEIIVEAINMYADDNGNDIYSKIPVDAFRRGNLAGLRANIYMFAGTGSRGTGHTLDRFRLGKELPFSQLKSGDFVNFNRSNGTGHAAVFLGYLDRSNTVTQIFSEDVIGFRYFSAQGAKSPDAGFALRNAYFGQACPAPSGSIRRDCGVIRSKNPKMLNSGRMAGPDTWNYLQGVNDVRSGVRAAFEVAFPGASKAFVDNAVDRAVNEELPAVQETEDYFLGITTD